MGKVSSGFLSSGPKISGHGARLVQGGLWREGQIGHDMDNTCSKSGGLIRSEGRLQQEIVSAWLHGFLLVRSNGPKPLHG